MKCPGCGIERRDLDGKCGICGFTVKQSTSPLEPSSTEEAVLFKGQPSWLYYVNALVIGLLFLVAGGVVRGPFILFLFVGLFVLIRSVLDQNTKIYTVTNRNIMAQSGILSRKTQEVGIRDIRSINMVQSITERMFGLGTVQIGSAGTSGIEVEFRGIRDPGKIRDLIRRAKESGAL